ncbi:MAG: phosphoribosylformylglycinamidine synthase subunit PurQ [Acidobacteriota bacterium]
MSGGPVPRPSSPQAASGKRVAVVVFPGSNCDRDALAAVEVAGGIAVPVWHESEDLQGCGAVILPGGFSYGDYLRAGAMASHSPVMRAVQRHAADGGAVLGICNGFQILLEVGLLPGAMLMNRTLRFICRDVHLRVERDGLRLLRGLTAGQVITLPIAHKEGNWFAEPAAVEWLRSQGAIALRYCAADGALSTGANPNGAVDNIAGLVNTEGNVLGMMPHPERRVDALLGGTDGMPIIRALVEAA